MRQFASDTALPLQLLACAIVAQLATGASSADAKPGDGEQHVVDSVPHDAVADTVILLLQVVIVVVVVGGAALAVDRDAKR